MGLNNNAHNLMLDALAAAAGYLSLHTADPGSTGTSEVTGGTYARKAATWSSASSSNLDLSNAPVFDVPAGVTITHWGLRSASSGGTFYGGAALNSPQTFGVAGTYTLTDLDVSLTAS